MRIRNVVVVLQQPAPPRSCGGRLALGRRCLWTAALLASVVAVSNAASTPVVFSSSSKSLVSPPISDRLGDADDLSKSSIPEAPAPTQASSSSGNVVVQLVGYVKTSVVKTVDGCGQLWRNHGRCNDIRKKIQSHRDAVKLGWEDEAGTLLSQAQKERLKTLVGGISYEEYIFLQQGKDDRSKVFNLMFLMWGAPRFLPYALMFNPDMLPSPFRERATGESVWATQSRERSTAVVQALLNLERDARVTPALAKLNFLGKKKQEEAKVQLLRVIDDMAHLLSSSLRPPSGAVQLLAQLQPSLYRDESDFSRAEKRLCHVPKSFVQGINGVLNGGAGGILAAVQPHFLARGRVVGHILKVAESDDFLITNNMNLTHIPKRFLQEACSERLMGVLGLSTDELRQQLGDWLALNTPVEGAGKYYNDNVARLALMGYYSCWAARGDQAALRLAPLLYQPPLPQRTRAESARSSAALTSSSMSTSTVGDIIESTETLSSKLRKPFQRVLRR
jgi:LETM1-like protein